MPPIAKKNPIQFTRRKRDKCQRLKNDDAAAAGMKLKKITFSQDNKINVHNLIKCMNEVLAQILHLCPCLIFPPSLVRGETDVSDDQAILFKFLIRFSEVFSSRR